MDMKAQPRSYSTTSSSDFLFTSTGTLDYSYINEGGGYKLNVLVDKQLAAYYRSLIPKYYSVNGTRYPPHITVLRPVTRPGDKIRVAEIPSNLDKWSCYQGMQVEFLYSPYIYNNPIYYWLRVYSQQLIDIRLELGLPENYHTTRPPDGVNSFHMTIANTKLSW